MTSLRRTLAQWVDERTEAIFRAPAMYGSLEAVELQILLLAEMRSVVVETAADLQEPGRVFHAYVHHLRSRFPGLAHLPLHEATNEPEVFIRELRYFIDLLRQVLPLSDTYTSSDLTVRLVCRDKERITATAVTKYYDQFRRATRALARGPSKGRVPKAIEEATDFALTDVQIENPNGAQGSALLALDRNPVQGDFLANESVAKALNTAASLVQWARSGEEVDRIEMPIKERTWGALQTLRLVPQAKLQAVEIDGRRIGWGQMTFDGAAAPRLVEAIGQGSKVEQLNAEGKIRAVDLDRGTFRFGQSRLECYAFPGILGDEVMVGGTFAIRGEVYNPLFGKHFALVRELASVDGPPDDE